MWNPLKVGSTQQHKAGTMKTSDKNAYGALLGFGGALSCIALAVARYLFVGIVFWLPFIWYFVR